MDLMHVRFHSDVLQRETRMIVMLPERANAPGMDEEKTAALPPFGGLYFLHGMGNGCTGITRWTNLDRYADLSGLAVFMPEGALAWYTDMKAGPRYYTYITEELPAICKRLFPNLSDAREDTFVAGMSMGGYGAFRCALGRPDLYAGAGLFAGDFEILNHLRDWGSVEREPDLYSEIFGTVDECRGGENDPFALVERRKGDPRKVPIFQCCGTRDPTYGSNLDMRDALRRNGWDVTWSDGDASHDFAYWDLEMKPFFDLIASIRGRA
jgi:S-formylglutathione hydrolase FrmB